MNQNIRKKINELFNDEIGPVEIEEENGIFWNCLDWPNYIKCPLNTELSSLIKLIQEGWCLSPPQIILSILSDSQTLNKWQNMEQIKNFQTGLVKAASSARIWIITNGLNIGASKITSEAIVNERNWQQSLINLNELESLKYMGRFGLFNSGTITNSLQPTIEPKDLSEQTNETIDSKAKQQSNQKRLDNDLINNFIYTLPIMKSVIVGVIDSNQIDSSPFFSRTRLDDIDQPSMDILSELKYARQYDLKLSNMTGCTDFNLNIQRSKGIDQNHSHFIFVQKTPEEDQDDEQLLALELFYELSYLGAWIMSKNLDKPDNLQQRVLVQKVKNLRIPFTAILMQGDFKTANVCSRYLVKQIPVLILKGTGGFADLISYAYTELCSYLVEQKRKSTTNTINASNLYGGYSHSNLYTSYPNVPDEYLERVLKPTLIRRIKQTFPKESKETRNYVQQFLDKILECVYYANQEGTEYVTIIDLNKTETKLEYLNEYLLQNYLKCKLVNQNEQSLKRPQEELDTDLKLTVDWNNYKIAKQILELYLRADYFTIDKSLFLRTLTKPKRELFAELFLKFGFKLRSIYTFDTLVWLMHKSSKNHLFLFICCQNILGLPYQKGFPLENEQQFMNALNKLIYMISSLKDFVSLNELTNRYNIEPNCLEQKALIFFTIWSVFNFNFELTKKLWPFSTYPIHLLLIISRSLITIANFIYDVSLRKQVDEHIQYFNDQVLELLDICYSKSSTIAIRTISDQVEHLNNFFVIDIAASIEHHRLIAHQSSQKWLDYKLMNGVHMKHSSLGDLINLIKIFLSVLFVFPILMWLDYPYHALLDQRAKIEKDKHKKAEQEIKLDEGSRSRTVDQEIKYKILANKRLKKKKIFSFFKSTLLIGSQLTNQIKLDQTSPVTSRDDDQFGLTDIKLKDKWLLLVTSPMSKYVFHFLNWLFFLSFLSYIVIRPGCGDRNLDLLLFFYIFIYYIELIRKMTFKYFNFISSNYSQELAEFILITSILIIFVNDRLNPFNHQSYTYNGRIALLILLFFAYLRLIFVFMPMFNTLAPLSYRIRMMSLHDIKMFIGLVWPFMIAFGIAIEVSLYPDRWLFNDKLTIQSFLHRTVITLFRTPSDELTDPNASCDQFKSNPIYNSTHCQTGDFNNFNCNSRGFFAHFYMFTYIFFLKILMLALLHALFNASLLSVEKNTIWRYQRFFLITNFDLNYPLPPPFCVIFYALDVNRFLINKLRKVDNYLKKKQTEHLLPYRTKSNQDVMRSLSCNCSDESIAFFWRSNFRELIKKSSQ